MQPSRTRIKGLILCAAIALAATKAAKAELKPGDTFPRLAGFKLEGKALPQLQGKVVLVDFWASWCAPCKKSFPVMHALQQKYGDQGLVIVAISVDENRADLDNFVKRNPVAFAIARDARQQLVNKVDVHTMPTSFLCDRDGKVRFVHSGFHDDQTRHQYEEEIQLLLKK